jgi:hypothetical protein
MSTNTHGDQIPIEITLIENDHGPVNKKISIGPDGKLVKESVASIGSGKAFRVPLADWRYLTQLENAAPTQVITLGRLRPGLGPMAYLTTEGNKTELAKPDRFSRTRGSIIYAAGEPVPVMIDFDDGGMPQSVKDEIEKRGGLVAAIESICPAFETAAYISRGSTSSGLRIDATGEPLTGGSHHYVILSDGADAERFLNDLFDRAWLNNMGWIQISAAGTLMKRCIIDKCVSDPGRLVFEADATLGAGLSQGPRPVTIHEGTPLVCPPRLTVEEIIKVNDLISWASKKAGPAARRQRKIWGAAHIEKMIAAGTPRAVAEKTVREWARGFLYPDALVSFYRPKVVCVSVQDILDDPKSFDGWLCDHPLEGSDYEANGKFYASSMTIFTHGHSGQVFRLMSTKEGL